MESAHITPEARKAVEALLYDGPVERTERDAGERAVRMLLDGLEVESILELKRLVDDARAADRLRGMVRQDAEWARDVLHSGTYEAGGSRHGDRALGYLKRIIERTGETT